jgi:phage repressor protein C with HTH and peptisase S24 domain
MPKLKLKTTHTHKKERSGIGVVVITTTQSTVKKIKGLDFNLSQTVSFDSQTYEANI